MDFRLSSDERLLQESVRRMVARDIQPVLAAHSPDAPLPKEAMRGILQVCARQGLTGARVPEAAGGAGLSTLTYGLMIEQLPPVVTLAVLAQEVTATRIHFDSTPEQRARLLPDLIAARKITCTGTTEPDVGSDPRGVKTR
ncbi:MAG: acyl-CoA dehydrogenase family protein, partial [Chloroflexota bacterium]